jgi:nucleotide-binding universal stress UspA family protein
MINIELAKTILVPTDFTHVGEDALKHANLFAAKTGKSITLLHVIASDSEKEKAMQKLNAIATANKTSTEIETFCLTSVGTIFDQIGAVADVINAAFVVMGTHGIVGMQKVTGSKALKVITKSHVPFIVIQKSPTHPTYKNIVIPISYQRESKQAIFNILELARVFGATCHLVYAHSNDEQLEMNINNNVLYAESFLSDNNVNHVSSSLGSNLSHFNDACLKYANEVNADLVTLITEQNITMAEFLMRPAEQFFIANDLAIPVMCIHPDYKAVQYGSVFAN